MEPAIMKFQRGFSLFVTLMLLIVISISTIAMFKIINSGTSAAGNIAFRQASLRVADTGIMAARNWILNQSNTSPLALGANISAGGYFAYVSYVSTPVTDPVTLAVTNVVTEDFIPASFNWEANAVKLYDPKYGGTASTTPFAGGYVAYYVIHRLSRPTDSVAAVNGGGDCAVPLTGCASPPQSGNISGQGLSQSMGSNYSPGLQVQPGLVYYRITIKVVGPKRNTSYVQAYMY